MHLHALRLAVLVAPLFALPASAHHSFAMFDQSKVIHVAGTVQNFEWVNPHAWLHIDLADTKGTVTTWSFEGGSPAQLASLGWKPENFHVGDKIEVGYRPMKDGSRGGQLMSAKLANGDRICSNRGCGDGTGSILPAF